MNRNVFGIYFGVWVSLVVMVIYWYLWFGELILCLFMNGLLWKWMRIILFFLVFVSLFSILVLCVNYRF